MDDAVFLDLVNSKVVDNGFKATLIASRGAKGLMAMTSHKHYRIIGVENDLVACIDAEGECIGCEGEKPEREFFYPNALTFYIKK